MATATKPAAVKATTLPKAIFDVEVASHDLLRLAYDAYLAEARQSGATTKTRGDVSGGGKKPWKQKGTGRARFGSSRNPIWRGGGIVFGPDGSENYRKRLSTTQKRVALKQALSLANKAGKLSSVTIPTVSGKTKELAAFIESKAANKRRVLLVVSEKTPEMIRASRNIANLEVKSTRYLTVFHLLNADAVLIDNQSIAAIETWLGGKK